MNNTDSNRIGSLEQKMSGGQTRQREVELESALEKVAGMAAELSMADTRERLRIASDVKNSIGQTILLAKINLCMLSGEKTIEGYESKLGEVRTLLDQAVDEIRALSLRLSPPLLDEAGLESALEYLCRQMESDYGLRVEFTDDGREKSLGDVAGSVVYHAVRELLFNVVQHAGTDTARLTVGRSESMFQLAVEDRGIGFKPAGADSNEMKTGCFGLLNIRQRIRCLGGDVTIRSNPGEGTGVTIRVPLTITQTAINNCTSKL